MPYTSSTIGAALEQLNRSYFLPAIQRPYVWKSDQVLALFDSLLKGYPISSFMLWAVEDNTRREVRAYRFFENYRVGDVLNEPVQTEGRDLMLVLDGQQRMTSLLIGLRGTFSEKARYKRKLNPDAWIRQTLYLDLLHDPKADDEDDAERPFGVTYGLRFLQTPPRNNHRHHWIKLGTILDYSTEDKLEDLIHRTSFDLHRGVPDYERELAVETLRRLHEVIWVEDCINVYTECDQSPDRVLDIFVRANDGGTKLSKSDLLMSMITSKWSGGQVREDIQNFVDHVNGGLSTPNAITRDFVLKACLVLCEGDVSYNVANFTLEAIATIEANWHAIKAAIEKTFRLINHFGITEFNLTSLNAVLPIAYYLYRSPEHLTFRGSSEFEGHNMRLVQQWLLQSLVVGAFAGSSDRTIALARATIRESLKSSRNFPAARLFSALGTGGRLASLDERGIEELLEIEYGKAKCFLALSLLYDDLDWGGAEYHIDHIIPESSATRRQLMALNIPEHRIVQILNAVHRLGNLQLLPSMENRDKGAISFAAWLQSRNRGFLDQHSIPDRPDLWELLMLPEFVMEREHLIRQRLRSRLLGSEAIKPRLNG